MAHKIIAVDFDGTLCEDKYPEIGAPKQYAIDLLRQEQGKGAKVILWTCREGDDLKAALEWCSEHDIYFDAVNDNLPDRTCKYWNNSRKVNADEYWDDKAVWFG